MGLAYYTLPILAFIPIPHPYVPVAALVAPALMAITTGSPAAPAIKWETNAITQRSHTCVFCGKDGHFIPECLHMQEYIMDPMGTCISQMGSTFFTLPGAHAFRSAWIISTARQLQVLQP